MERFDAIDRRILAILRENGRASHAYVAKQVHLSAPAVGERIRKLEASGVISGYRAVLAPDALGLNICAFVALAPKPGTQVADLVQRLLALSEIEELHSVAGTYSYFAKVRVTDPVALDAFLDRLMMMEGVERTETTMVLRTSTERAAPLPWSDVKGGVKGGVESDMENDAATESAVGGAA
ncbi:MAG: Lrp/AsnC family transcriptional regulator [Trueperaceae bacterium]